jgi:hypothetical protein
MFFINGRLLCDSFRCARNALKKNTTDPGKDRSARLGIVLSLIFLFKLWPNNTPQRHKKLEAELPVELADRVWDFVYGEASAD